MTETASLVIKVDSTGAARASGDLDKLGRSAKGAEEKIGLIPGAMRLVSAVAASAAVATATSAYIAMADASANMAARLKLATGSTEEFNRAQAATYQIAQRSSTELASVVDLYAKLSQSTGELSVSQSDLLQLTESITQTFQISGASAQEASGGLRQLSQAMAGGVLRAEEFNSIIESAPRLVQAMADGMGIAFGDVRKHVNDGKVSSEILVNALLTQSQTIQAEFDQMPLTVGRAMTQLRNSLTGLVGDADEAGGASKNLATAISDLARTLESAEVKDGFASFVNGLSQVVEWGAKAGVAIDYLNRSRLAFAGLREQASAGIQGFLLAATGQDASVSWRAYQGGSAKIDQAFAPRASSDVMAQPQVAGIADFAKAPTGSGESVSAELRKQLDEIEKQARAYGLSRAALAELNREKALSAAANDKEREAINKAYDALVQRIGAVDGAKQGRSSAKDALTAAGRRDSILDVSSFTRDQIRDEASAIDEANKATAGWLTRIEDLRAELQGPLAVATLAYQRALEQVNTAQAAGHISTEQAAEAQRLLREEFDATSEKIKEGAETMDQYSIQAARNIQSHFSDFLFDPFEGGVSGMVKGFSNALRRMGAEAASSEVLKAVGGWASSYTGAGSGWINAIGGVLTKGGRAHGGPVMAGSSYLVGERGRPEIFTPSTAGRISQVGGGGQTVNRITIQNAPPGTTASDPRQNSMGGFDMTVIVGQIEKQIGGNIAQGSSPVLAGIKGRLDVRERV